MKQKVERLSKVLRGSPEEEVRVWSDHCLHLEESCTDKRHCAIIVAPGHWDFIKNMTTDALQMGTTPIMVPADGSFATAISKDNRKANEIQGQIRQHSRLINTLGARKTRISVNRIDRDAAGWMQEGVFETSNGIRSMLIKIGSKECDHRLVQKVADESFVKGQTQEASQASL